MRQTKIILVGKKLRCDKYNKLPYNSNNSTTSYSSKAVLRGNNNNGKYESNTKQ